MKIFIMSAVILLFAQAHAKDKVGQGAGVSESNILFAHTYIDLYLELCLSAKDCATDDRQREVLEKILGAMPEEKKNTRQIVFKSHRKDGIFWVDGQVRIAKTFSEIGSTIYFNLDQLYSLDGDVVVGLSIDRAVALLVHELGHHHGVRDHTWLDQLGQRVGRLLHGRIHSNILHPDRANIELTSIHFDPSVERPRSTQVLIRDDLSLYDLGNKIHSVFRCPDVGGVSSQLVGLTLWNFSWRAISSSEPVAIGFAMPHCQSREGVWSPRGFGVQIQTGLEWKAQERRWQLREDRFFVRQVTCADEPIVCGWDVALKQLHDLLETQGKQNTNNKEKHDDVHQ